MFFLVTLILFAATFLTMASIVRDMMPHMDFTEKEYFRGWIHNWGTLKFGAAIRRLWDQHCQRFPNSRKRLVFAFLLVVALLSPSLPLLLEVLRPNR